MIKLFIPCVVLLTFLVISCSKSGPDNIAPVLPPGEDTLSAGWTKITPWPGFLLTGGGDVYFRNNDTGYLSGGNGTILKSVNGGITWDSIFNSGATNMTISQDNKAFFVKSTQNSVWSTRNQGATFTEQVITGRPYDITMPGTDTGIYVKRDEVMLTTTGGDNWFQLVPFPDNNPGDETPAVSMWNSQKAWVVYGNKIFHPSGDLYSSWRLDSIVRPITNWNICSVFASSATTVYVTSFSGYIYRSDDGGSNFSFLAKPEAAYHSNLSTDIHFVNANQGWMSVGSRLYKTTDAGSTWTLVVSLGTTDIIEIHFTDASHGWACCVDGSLLKFN